MLRSLLAQQLDELHAHEADVRAGEDPEALHQFRVATRRSRALIRATRPVLGERLEPLAAELKWLAELLGSVRDLDVLIEHLHAAVAELDYDRPAGDELVAMLSEERERHRLTLLAGLGSDRYVTLLGAFSAEVTSLPAFDGDARALAADALAKLKKQARKLPASPPDAELHELRKTAKKARYTAELAALERSKPIERYVDALKKLQDTVGEHQDAVVAEERLRAVARARTAIAAGRLIECERARRRAARKAYPAVLDAALELGAKAF
jgi:CHAD domain-containing protein